MDDGYTHQFVRDDAEHAIKRAEGCGECEDIEACKAEGRLPDHPQRRGRRRVRVPTIPPLAADLDPVALRHRIEANTQAAELKAEAMVALHRIERRISWLERKHARLPIGNAKRKTAKQISEGKARSFCLSADTRGGRVALGDQLTLAVRFSFLSPRLKGAHRGRQNG